MLEKDFKTKYIIYISGSLYEKEAKLTKVFKTLNDEFIKNNVNILIKYEDLVKYKKVIKALKKEGYNFSVDMTGVEKVKKTDEAMLHLVEFIFIKKEDATKTNIIELIPEDIKSRITYDDISSKVGNF
jgi:NADH:ubiquinone oxidoreductase subunit C